MKIAVLISIKPYWCDLIKNGMKTIEVRKSIPKLDTPFKCYIYCTKGECLLIGDKHPYSGNRMVIGEFICDKIERFSTCTVDGSTISEKDIVEKSCMTIQQLAQYELNAIPKEFTIQKIGLYGWHISDLKIYDKPKELSEFSPANCGDKHCFDCECFDAEKTSCTLKRPPQSWRYVEEREGDA